MTSRCTEELFLNAVAAHEMSIIRDEGVHRHIRFARPGTVIMRFDLITWPGYLCYTGDMGAYVFSRCRDMLDFFRDQGEGPLYIDPDYWVQALRATDRIDGHMEYSADTFREWVAEQLKEFQEHLERDALDDDDPAEQFEALTNAVERDVLSRADDGEFAVFQALKSFEHDDRHWFADSREVSFRQCTFQFLWCCYALVWAIRKYDEKLKQ